MPGNQLFYGDNLDVLRHSIKDASVDLIYLVGCPILSHLLGKGWE